ncbi:hypothetical protein Nmel_005949 [Mimus melanotis]
MIQLVCKQVGGHWLSPSWMLKYRVVLLEQDHVMFKTTSVVNPAMFLSAQQVEGSPDHVCLHTYRRMYSSRPDLGGSALERPDWELFNAGSSFV